MRVLVRGKAWTHGEFRDVEVLVEDGWITEVKRRVDREADVTIKLRSGEALFPAAVDLHVHCRDPHPDHPFDFKTETLRFLAGGTGTVVDMPNTEPAPLDIKTYREKEELAREKGLIEVVVSGAVSSPSNVRELREAGVTTFGEVFLAPSTDAPRTDLRDLPAVMRAAEDAWMSFHTELGDMVEEGRPEDLLEHARMRPPEAEIAAAGVITSLLPRTNVRAHAAHLTLPESVEAFASIGERATVEVTPHHLMYDLLKVDVDDPVFKVNPPIRSRQDRLALLDALRRGQVDVIATDHAPHRLEGDEDVSDVPSGVSSGGLLLPLALTLWKRYGVPLSTVVDAVTRNPAMALGRDDLGRIRRGCRGRLVVIEMKDFECKAEDFLEEGRKFPYDCETLYGLPVKMITEDGVYDLVETRAEGEPVPEE